MSNQLGENYQLKNLSSTTTNLIKKSKEIPYVLYAKETSELFD